MLIIGPENVIAMKPANITAITNFYASWSQANKTVVPTTPAIVAEMPSMTVNPVAAPAVATPVNNTVVAPAGNQVTESTTLTPQTILPEVPVAGPVITEAPQVMSDTTAVNLVSNVAPVTELIAAPSTPADMLAQEFASASPQTVQPVATEPVQMQQTLSPNVPVIEVQPTAPTIVETIKEPINNLSKEEIIAQINKIEEAIASLKNIVNEKLVASVNTPGGVLTSESGIIAPQTAITPAGAPVTAPVNTNVIPITNQPIVNNETPVIEAAPQQIIQSTQLIPEGEIIPFAPPGVSGNIFDEQPAQASQPMSMAA